MGYIIGYAGKTKCGTRHLPFHLFVALMLALQLLGGQKCYSQEDPELLRFIADGYEVNLELLRTWRGTATRRAGKSPAQPLDGNMPLNFKEEVVEQLKFVADRDKDAALWYGSLAGQKYLNGEGNLQSSRINSGMNKGEYHYKMDTMKEPELDPRQKRRLLAYSKDTVSHGFQNVEFDPVWVLIEDIGAHGTMGQALRNCAQGIEKKTPLPEGHGFDITRKGSVVTLKIYGRVDGGGTSSSSYVFDIAKGCSMVGQHNVSPQSETHWKLDYEEHNGVFVPKEITRVNRDESMGLHHHIAFTTEMVNEPVSESEFSYEALGLRPGDYIIDHAKGGLQYQWRLNTDVAIEVMEELADETPVQPVKNNVDSPKTKAKASPPPADGVKVPPIPSEEEVTTAQPTQQKATSTILFGLGILGIITIVVFVVIVTKLKAKNEEGTIR